MHIFEETNLVRYLRESSRSTSTANYTDYSVTTSVTIRVTPHNDYIVSWSILWTGFLIAIIIASVQVYREKKIIADRRQAEEADNSANDGEAVSTADLTRSMFRKLLLIAMISRAVLVPVQIWSAPIWLQFICDTLPEMIFASAWTLLVSFFVQLVSIAMGTGTNTSPGIVIQTTAYVVYLILISVQIWNAIATVLLYALLCCIYAGLFGTVVYFCPRLISLLRPSLTRHDGLAARLLTCTVMCILVFLAHTIDYARLVVSPPRKVYWWWSYGVLELFPALIFLAIMSPSSSKGEEGREEGGAASSRDRKPTLRSSESGNSISGVRRVGYGSIPIPEQAS